MNTYIVCPSHILLTMDTYVLLETKGLRLFLFMFCRTLVCIVPKPVQRQTGKKCVKRITNTGTHRHKIKTLNKKRMNTLPVHNTLLPLLTLLLKD